MARNWQNFMDSITGAVHNAKDETIELFFLVSELIDIPQSPSDKADRAYYDSMATRTEQEQRNGKRRKPLDKTVF